MAQPRAMARSSLEPSSVFMVGNFQELVAIFRTFRNCPGYRAKTEEAGAISWAGWARLGLAGAAGSGVARRRRSSRDVRPLHLVPQVDRVLPTHQDRGVAPRPAGRTPGR